jgi:hypothetical protein
MGAITAADIQRLLVAVEEVLLSNWAYTEAAPAQR